LKVKICGIKEDKDIKAIIGSDVDAVGFLVGQVHPSPDFILASTAGRLAKLLPPYITPVIVTHLDDVDEIMAIVEKTGITTIQLYGNNSLEDVKKLKDILPVSSKLIFAVHIIDDKCSVDIMEYIRYIDSIIIDSFNEEKSQVGGTGLTHNWNISAKLVEELPIPIILAGGLNPDNVEKAIRLVKPYGVDANSGLRNAEGSQDCDLCKRFVAKAKLCRL